MINKGTGICRKFMLINFGILKEHGVSRREFMNINIFCPLFCSNQNNPPKIVDNIFCPWKKEDCGRDFYIYIYDSFTFADIKKVGVHVLEKVRHTSRRIEVSFLCLDLIFAKPIKHLNTNKN